MQDLRNINSVPCSSPITGKLYIKYTDMPNNKEGLKQWDEVINSLPIRNEWLDRNGSNVTVSRKGIAAHRIQVYLIIS